MFPQQSGELRTEYRITVNMLYLTLLMGFMYRTSIFCMDIIEYVLP